MGKKWVLNPDTGRMDAAGMSAAVADAKYVKLNQTTPQTITNGNVSVDDPVSEAHIANKKYVDEAIPLTNTFFFYNSDADISGYKYMYKAIPTGVGELSFTGVADNDLLLSFVTQASQPDFETVQDGVHRFISYAQKTSGNKDCQLYFKLFKRTTAGVETEIFTTGAGGLITGTLRVSQVTYYQPTFTFGATDRLVVKVYVAVTGVGLSPSITVFLEDETRSRYELPVTSAALPDMSNYSTKAQADLLYQPKSNCSVHETTDFLNLASPFGAFTVAVMQTGTFAFDHAIPFTTAGTNYDLFRNRSGVYAFRAHATNSNSGAVIRTGSPIANKQMLSVNKIETIRASVLLPRIVDGMNSAYGGENVIIEIGFGVGGTSRTSGAQGSACLHIENSSVYQVMCVPALVTTTDTTGGASYYGNDSGMGGYTSLTGGLIPTNTWLLMEAQMNKVDNKLYVKIYNQETKTLIYSNQAMITAIASDTEKFMILQNPKLSAVVIAQNAYTASQPILYVDWIDYCVEENVNNEINNWGKFN